MISILENPPRPGSPAWLSVVSASKVPAILGLSRWQSPFSLWHEMAGNLEPEKPDASKARRFLWGHMVEESLAQFWKANNDGWLLNTRRGDSAEITYCRDDLPFPAIATLDRRAMNRRFAHGDPRRFHILECKLAQDLKDNLDHWGRPGEPDSVPADYFAQVQFQMGISGIPSASFVVLGAFGDPEIHNVEFDEPMFDDMVATIAGFMKSIREGTPPPLSDSVADYKAVRGLHPDIAAKKVVQIDKDAAAELLAAAIAEDTAKAAARRAKSEAALLMGDAKYLKCGDVKIADRRSKNGGTPFVQFEKKANLEGIH